MKKLISLTLILCVMLGCLALPCAAQDETGPISLRLNSDIAGCTRMDVDKLIEIRSPQVTFYPYGDSPIRIANYAGGSEYAHMDAGRTYDITYTLVAAEGYTLPEEISDGDVVFDCGKGVDVVYCKVVEIRLPDSAAGENARVKALKIIANVVVDGTAFQRIIGWCKDVILKIRSWSLY